MKFQRFQFKRALLGVVLAGAAAQISAGAASGGGLILDTQSGIHGGGPGGTVLQTAPLAHARAVEGTEFSGSTDGQAPMIIEPRIVLPGSHARSASVGATDTTGSTRAVPSGGAAVAQ